MMTNVVWPVSSLTVVSKFRKYIRDCLEVVNEGICLEVVNEGNGVMYT